MPSWCRERLALALAARGARHGLQHRRRGGRPARPVARRHRAPCWPIPSSPAGTGSASWCRPMGRARPSLIDWLDALAEAARPRHHGAAGQGRLLGHRDQARRRRWGLPAIPVFTRKASTDVCYIANARKLLGDDRPHLPAVRHPQCPHRRRGALAMAGRPADAFEFQRLHGMGEALHETVREREGTRCRIYAPVGAHPTCWPIWCAGCSRTAPTPPSSTRSPTSDAGGRGCRARSAGGGRGARAPSPIRRSRRPARSFAPARDNSKGFDITDPVDRWPALDKASGGASPAGPLARRCRSRGPPARARRRRSSIRPSRTTWSATVHEAARRARSRPPCASPADAQPAWATRPVAERAAILERAADLYEANAAELFALAHPRGRQDAGRRGRRGARGRRFPALLRRRGGETADGTQARGVIVCISPWNFPLAIFTGQVAAALVAGNAVIAKPAEQTPLIASRAVELLREAGVPADVHAAAARRRPDGRRAADRRSAHRRRLLHRLDRGRQADRASSWPRPPRPTRC